MLRKILSTLEEIFHDLLRKLHPADRPRSTFLFQLVLFAERRLIADEIAAAISFHLESHFKTIEEWTESNECISGLGNQMAMVIKLSGGLLEFDREGYRTCQFNHESARDHFLENNGFQTLFILQQDASIDGLCHSAIAMASANYLRAIPVEACDVTSETPFGRYFNFRVREACEQKFHGYEALMLEHDALRPENIAWRPDYGATHWEHVIFKFFPFLRYAIDNVDAHVEIAEEKDISQETTLKNLHKMDASTNFLFRQLSHDPRFDPEHLARLLRTQ